MHWGLNLKFISYTVFIVVFISLVCSVVFIYQSRKALLGEFHKTSHALVDNLARNSEVPLLLENRESLRSLAQNLLTQQEVQRVTISAQDGTVLVRLAKERALAPWLQEQITSPVYFHPEGDADSHTEGMPLFFSDAGPADQGPAADGRVLGQVAVLFSRAGIIDSVSRMRWWIFVAATIACVIGGIAALYFSHTLIMPMQRLARATYSIARGNWSQRLAVQRTDELGQLTESFNIMADSLEVKKEQLEKSYRELAVRDRMAEMGKLSMIIAHELKNPLGIIKGSVDILSKKQTAEEVRGTMVEYIQDEVRRLDRLINDFLSFAKPAPPLKHDVDINALVQRARDALTEAGHLPAGIHIECCLADAASARVDEHQIYQALLNLLTNALQALGDSGTITIQTARSDTGVTLQVQDTGPGISDEVRESLFEPFVTTRTKGTGLGLAIVKKIIESHQGRITVTSTPATGACFAIDLPS